MRVFALKSIVGVQGIGVQGRASLTCLLTSVCNTFPCGVRNHAGANLPATLKHSHDSGFIFAASASDSALAFADVHVRALPPMKVSSTSTSAAVAAHLHERFRLHGKANAMHHEPCGFLSDAEIAPAIS